ncbi:MAG: hypothetical protein IV100_20820, partial [Myxococcales bacterium]|nr:hypothetical protein [Myxococcales bacterium]
MIQCPQCGQLNEPFFKFCLMCGSPLEGAATVSRGPTRSERPAKPEAKTPARAPVGGSPSLGKPAPAATPAAPAPAPIEPAPVEPAPGEPALFGSAPVEPAPVEPVPVEPAPVEPAPADSDATFDDDEELGARDMPAPARTVTPVPAPASEPEPEPEPEPKAAPSPTPEPAAPSGGKVRRRTRFTLVVIREDMSDGERFALDEGIFTVGREGTSVEFPEDVYLDPFHASLDVTERGVTVVDQGSVNGTFWRIDAPIVLEH